MMIFETVSGARYEVDLEGKTLRRVPGEDSSKLRKDEETVPLLADPAPTVGESCELWLDIRGDGVPTLRLTTPVESIED